MRREKERKRGELEKRTKYSLLVGFRYDLKGSLHGRTAFAKKPAEDEDVSGVIQKDLDFNRRLVLGPRNRVIFLGQLIRDAEFLDQMGIMDYSLLLGIHLVDRGMPKTRLRRSSIMQVKPQLDVSAVAISTSSDMIGQSGVVRARGSISLGDHNNNNTTAGSSTLSSVDDDEDEKVRKSVRFGFVVVFKFFLYWKRERRMQVVVVVVLVLLAARLERLLVEVLFSFATMVDFGRLTSLTTLFKKCIIWESSTFCSRSI